MAEFYNEHNSTRKKEVKTKGKEGLHGKHVMHKTGHYLVEARRF